MWWMLAVAQAGAGWTAFPAPSLSSVQGDGRPAVVAVGEVPAEVARYLPNVSSVRVVKSREARRSDEEILTRAALQTGWVLRSVEGLSDTVVASFHGEGQTTRVLLMTGGRVVSTAGARPRTEPGDGAQARGEAEAAALLGEAHQLWQEGDLAAAGPKLAELLERFPTSRAARIGRRLAAELEVVGTPARLEVEHWFQGEVSLEDHRVTLLVFWEVWCPHCKREVPELQELYERYGERLGLVGLTKMTRNVSEEQVRSFLTDHGVTYPIALERSATMSAHYGVHGVPAAAVVREGQVIWRGHPARLTDALVERWLSE